ncbi:purine catabolism regulatory family protein [Kribbella steppae]|uniref:Purine catabolism regulatory family protein n=1 Tax=Kribbella steppae TaxID=2512223 RepID=A0A4R2GZS3_9ACTN|nr:PucR family transcriptional regulator [Kribbella steppae]TCO17309.1 purine catabolism regulatory family protein [Kribbella steppae]
MLTLAALIGNPALELRLLVPGPAGALDREALWVHNTELPDPSPYVRAGEIVLTNGLWQDETTASAFAANVRRAGAAGIVFGLRTETPATPEELIEACRREELPLAEISIEVPFTAVTEAASVIHTDQRRDALVGMVRRGDALAAAISHGAGASGVLAVLRREHDLPLAVVDRMARPLAAAGVELTPEQRRIVAEGLARHPPPLEVDLGGQEGRATVFLVGAVGDTDAALLCLRPVSGLKKAEQDALDQAARFLSLEVAKQQAIQAIELRFASELLDMILSGGHRAAEVPDRLRAFGVDPSGELVVLTIAFADGAESTLPGLSETVGEFFLAQSLAVVVAGGSQDVVAVLQRPRLDLSELAEALCSVVRKRFPERRPVVGLGDTAASAGELRQPLVQSREACQVLRRRRGAQAVASFRELGTHRLLLGLQDAGTLQGFADGVVGPIREHDGSRAGELEVTLRAFLSNDGHFGATAAALYVHVNTLRNRLAKITELTGRDVARTEDRVDLYLALEADDMSRSR